MENMFPSQEKSPEDIRFESDLSLLLKDEKFLNFTRRLLMRYNPNQISYTGEPMSTAFLEGKRSVIIDIIETLKTGNPGTVARLLTEI